jgi:hypothetical protein
MLGQDIDRVVIRPTCNKVPSKARYGAVAGAGLSEEFVEAIKPGSMGVLYGRVSSILKRTAASVMYLD